MALAALIALLVFPLVVPATFVSLGFIAIEYALFALGLNMVVGWMGLLDLGAAGFVAVGAYTSAICMTHFGWPAVVTIPTAAAAGFLAGVALGIPTLRHREDYFAILTLGFAELVALGIRNWPGVTKGAYGYSGIPQTRLPFFTEPLRAYPPVGFYYLALATLVPACCFVLWLRATSLGKHFHLVKHNETVGACYGINITLVKVLGFGFSAMLLSTGGFFWAAYQRSIVWTEFGVLLSCLLLSMIVVGGQGNPVGVMLGAAVIGTSQEVLRRLLTSYGLPQNIRYLVFALCLVVFVHWRYRGILPDRPRWKLNRLRQGRPPTERSVGRIRATPDAPTSLRVNEVAKAFGGVRALDGVSLELQAEECIALVGPNGSGKSTLLNLISGVVKPDRGEILLDGLRIDTLPAHRVARLGVRRSFQDLSVFDDLSLQDNIGLTAVNPNVSEVDEAIARFQLPPREAGCAGVSYGTKKSLDLARIFVRPAALRFVLLDEPTAGLTQAEAQNVVRSLSAIRAEHQIAMVVVSHDLKFLEALQVDRVVVMDAGRVFREGTFRSMRTDEGVIRLFWGD